MLKISFFRKQNLDVNLKPSIIPFPLGDLNKLQIKDLIFILKSDVYLVFGSSYIKK